MASFADILRDLDSSRDAKLAAKLPEWAGVDGLVFPTSLSLEQCSSSALARHKASLATGARRIADLTGGLGVDSWAFSRVAQAVWYNEGNAALMEAVRGNFACLGVENAVFNNYMIEAGRSDWEQSLRDFAPDMIYLDPARRSAAGRKVFLPEDCSPDFLTLLPTLLDIAPRVMVKLSPMADITMLQRRIGDCLAAIRVIGLGDECKELLCDIVRMGDIIRMGDNNPCRIIVDIPDRGLSLDFTAVECADTASPVRIAQNVAVGMYLAEPHAAVVKAGAADAIAARSGFAKLERFTHLYIGDTLPVEGAAVDDVIPFASALRGGLNRIVDVMDFGKASMADIGRRYPKADFTARNIPMSSDELRRRCKSKPSTDGTHVWGVLTAEGRKLIVTVKE